MDKFISGRLKKDEFVGLPLTIIVFTVLIIIAAFQGLIETVTNTDFITNIDSNFTQYLFKHRSEHLVDFFYAITQFGSIKIIGVLIPAAIGALFVYKKRDLILPLLISIVGSELAVYFIKLGIQRLRPGEPLSFYVEKSYSFPSGHSTVSMAFYGFMIYFFLRTSMKKRSSIFISVILGILIFLVGFSRIYLGVHYLSDVVGGYLLGLLWLLLAISIREILGWRRSKLV